MRHDNNHPQVHDNGNELKHIDMEPSGIDVQFAQTLGKKFHVKTCVDKVIMTEAPLETKFRALIPNTLIGSIRNDPRCRFPFDQ